MKSLKNLLLLGIGLGVGSVALAQTSSSTDDRSTGQGSQRDSSGTYQQSGKSSDKMHGDDSTTRSDTLQSQKNKNEKNSRAATTKSSKNNKSASGDLWKNGDSGQQRNSSGAAGTGTGTGTNPGMPDSK
jgi:hypothetical protein